MLVLNQSGLRRVGHTYLPNDMADRHVDKKSREWAAAGPIPGEIIGHSYLPPGEELPEVIRLALDRAAALSASHTIAWSVAPVEAVMPLSHTRPAS